MTTNEDGTKTKLQPTVIFAPTRNGHHGAGWLKCQRCGFVCHQHRQEATDWNDCPRCGRDKEETEDA